MLKIKYTCMDTGNWIFNLSVPELAASILEATAPPMLM